MTGAPRATVAILFALQPPARGKETSACVGLHIEWLVRGASVQGQVSVHQG